MQKLWKPQNIDLNSVTCLMINNSANTPIKLITRLISGLPTVFLLIFICSGSVAAKNVLSGLTSAEKEWLETHNTIRVQLAEDWPPYNYTEDDQPRGYINEYLILLVNKLGLEVDFVRGFSWSQYVEMLKAGDIDCISNMTITPERKKEFIFSQKSVIDVFNGILTLKNNTEIADLEKLQGLTLAVPKGYAQEELLKQYYPDIKLLLTENLLESIRKVMSGKAEAAIGAHAVFNYYITKHLLNEVQSIPVAGNVIFPSAPHYLAVSTNNSVLIGLLDKAAASLDTSEIDHLKQRWYLTKDIKQLQLNKDEQLYLNAKDQLNLCVDPDWMPMESISNGRHIGLASEYIKLLSNRLGVKTNLIPTDSWEQTLKFSKDRQCDILSMAMSTPERRLYLHFTKPYFSTPLVIATRESTNYIADPGTLTEKRFGVKEDYAFAYLLREKYPNLDIVGIDTMEQGLQKVREGQLFGFFGSLPTLVYNIQRNFPSDLKIAGSTGEEIKLGMGIRNDEPFLLTAMNKAIDSITDEERQEILNRWIAVQYEEGTDYTLVFQILIGGVLLFSLLLYRQITLKRFNRSLQLHNKEILKQSKLLQDAQKQLLLTQYAVDSCSFPICWVHYDPVTDRSHVIHANNAAEKCLGYTVDELVATESNDIIDNMFALEDQENTARTGSAPSQPLITNFQRKDGSVVPVELHISHFVYDDKHYRFIFFNDISAQREIEEKLHRSMKMEAVGLMAGGVAHDLNNILSGIVSYPELLLLKLEPDHPMRSQLAAIKKSGEQAALVVNDLLTMVRGVAAVRETANLNTLIIDYLESPEFEKLQQHFPEVDISLNLEQGLQNIHCSPLHIKKSIMNLITNGYEATVPGGRVILSTFNQIIEEKSVPTTDLKPGNYVCLAVQDSGTGIPEDVISRIFEPFYSKKQMGRSGTGLGLSIVWNTAQDHDGSIIAENTDKGAKFLLFLPATNDVVTAAKETMLEESLYGNNEKVLVIDDEPQQLDIAKEMLQTLGYTPLTASSGEEAIPRLQQEEFNLILLDMIMTPGLSGRETYEKIKELRPNQKALIVSGFSDSNDVKATLSMGACAYVRKPYSIHTLAVAVKDALLKS